MNLSYWINQGWHWQSRREGMRFQQSVHEVRDVQERVLLTTLNRNRTSAYGQKFRFDSIQSIDDFRDRVPVVRYDALSEYVDRIVRGESNVLTSEPVERLVPTGGSSGGAKLVPYTASLKQDFQKAIAAWVWSTFQTCPDAMHGRAYWSITPMASTSHKSSASIPIGFESDSDYLGAWSKWFAEKLILPPSLVGKIRSVENARYANLLYWMACSDLALISVWSPTFLLSLLNQIDPWIESICRDIGDGMVRLPRHEPSDSSVKLTLTANRRRAEELKCSHRDKGTGADFLRDCWPRLSLLSCWGDGNSAYYFSKLQKLFPQARMQAKGLLATECVVSFPTGAHGRCALSVRSHFFEFAPVGTDGRIDYSRLYLADELQLGNKYRVIVTTNGGFYRYDLGDVVEVNGFDAMCPLLQFVGRMDAVSDLVGEKLNEEHVRTTLVGLFRELDMEQALFLLVVREPPLLGYTLLLSADTNLPEAARDKLANFLDERLRSNPQYDLARNLNQLVRVDVRILPWCGRELWSRYEDWQNGIGKRVGELKANVLDYRGTWREFLSEMEKASTPRVMQD